MPDQHAECMHPQYSVGMASITIRDVPDEARAELAARAARSGRSMQEYVRLKLIEIASVPEREEVLAQIRRRKASTEDGLSLDQVLEAKDADRR